VGPTHPTLTVIDQTIHAHTVSRMSVPPTLQDLADTAHALNPEVAARFDAVRVRMPYIAEAVNAFASPTLQERAFYELVSIINPSSDDDEPISPEIERLAAYLTVLAAPGETVTEVAVRVLGPLAREAPTEVPAWYTRNATDDGLHRESDRVDDRKHGGQ
jgi:hypothetical protein